jgi:nucleotide-binding universal stress UspA family protein
MKILCCYDGSPDSNAAIEAAGELFPGASTTVLTVWEGLSEVLVRAGAGLAAAPLDFGAIDAESEQGARECADAGTALAREAGLAAESRIARRSGTIWETILRQADLTDSELVVLGSRGLTGVKAVLLGSVSHAVLQHSSLPVIIVPTTRLASDEPAAVAKPEPASLPEPHQTQTT